MRSAHHESPVVHEQTYTVGWSPGVYVRAEPRLDARPIGVRRAGTLVRAKCMWGPWIEVGPAADSPDTPSYGGRGAGGWMLADGDAIGCGRMLSPCGEGAREHKWQHGRDARTMLGFENALAAWKQHPMLSVLRTEHALRGLPMVATEDACALLGAGVGGVRLFPWRVRPLRGESNAIAATQPPPPPPADYSPVTAAGTYQPPKAYEAGANLFDFSKILNPTKYEGACAPPKPPPPELRHAMDVCTRTRPKGGGKGTFSIGVIGLPEDEMLVVACGGRFELPPERCALLERRYVRLLDRVRDIMSEIYQEHLLFKTRVAALNVEYPGMSQHMDKRLFNLSVYTERELRTWFSSGGYTTPNLGKTDERQIARNTRTEELHRLQSHLQRLRWEADMAVAQRCRGWAAGT